MIYKPRHDIVFVEKIEENEHAATGIILPGKGETVTFIKLKVVALGPAVEDLKVGDIVYAEDMVQPILKSEKNKGLIIEKYIHCKVIENDGQPIN